MISGSPKIFLSYARSDLAAARELRGRIEAELGEGTVWHDVRNLSGDLWWIEIEEKLRDTNVEHVVLLASKDALERPIVRREWRLAWREGKTVTNVFWSARTDFTSPDFDQLPRWIKAKSFLDLSIPDRWQALVERLEQSRHEPRRPVAVPPLPPSFVDRPEEFRELKRLLLGRTGEATSTTAVLRGAGGFGKTFLAIALANDDDIQDAFQDGVIWITLGQRASVMEKLSELLNTLTGEIQAFTDIRAATSKLREILAERTCLLVIDDLWKQSHLQPFLDLGPQTARLVTSRRDDILPANVELVVIGSMKAGEALELLSQGLRQFNTAESDAARSLATKRLGEWPLLIRLVNAFLRREITRGSSPLEAVRLVNDRLDSKGLTYFDRNDEDAREAAVDSTIRASVDYLVEALGARREPEVFSADRFHELGVFPEGAEVPVATIARLWERVAQLSAIDTRDLLQELYSLALLEMADLSRGVVRMHNLLRKYVVQQHSTADLRALHEQLVGVYGGLTDTPFKDDAERRYYYAWLPTHLHAAESRDALDRLLLDVGWMRQKLEALDGPWSLLADFREFARLGSKQALVGRAIELSAYILSAAPEQLLAQLEARLFPDGERILDLKSGVRSQGPALRPLRPNLKRVDSPVVRTLSGHTGTAFKIVLGQTSGHIFSCSTDRTIKEWNWTTGELVATFGPFDDGLRSLAVNKTEDLIIAGCGEEWMDPFSRYELAGWSVPMGATKWRREVHENPVSEMSLNPSTDEAISAGWDQHLRFWRPSDGKTTREPIEAHSQGINGLAVNAEWTVAFTAASDGNIRKWSLADGVMLLEIKTSESCPLCVALDAEGRRLVGGGSKGVVRVWDAETGALLVTCADAGGGDVNSVCFSPDGRMIVAGLSNRLIAIFDSGSGELTGYRLCDAPVMWVIFVGPEMLACAEGADITIVSLPMLQQTDRPDDLRTHFGVRKVGAVIQSEEFLCLGLNGDLSVRSVRTLDVLGLPTEGVRGFAIRNRRAYLVCDEAIKVVDLATGESESTVIPLRSERAWECEHVYVTDDELMIIVWRKANTVRCDAFSIRGKEAKFHLWADWDDEGVDVFRAMMGMGNHHEKQAHSTGYTRCDVMSDGTVALYFNQVRSVLLFDVLHDKSRFLNYADYFGRLRLEKADPAPRGPVSGDGGSLSDEYGLQRSNVGDIAFCGRKGRRALALAVWPSTIAMVDCGTDESATLDLGGQTLRGMAHPADCPDRVVILTDRTLSLLDAEEVRCVCLREIDALARVWAVNLAVGLAICSGPPNALRLVCLDQQSEDASYYFDGRISDVDVNWEARQILVGGWDGRMHALSWGSRS